MNELRIVHTKTQEEYDRVVAATDPNFGNYYKGNKTVLFVRDKSLSFGGIEYAKQEYPYIKIETADEFLGNAKFKVGDKVRLKAKVQETYFDFRSGIILKVVGDQEFEGTEDGLTYTQTLPFTYQNKYLEKIEEPTNGYIGNLQGMTVMPDIPQYIKSGWAEGLMTCPVPTISGNPKDFYIDPFNNEAQPHKKGIIMSVVSKAKKIALKATNPDEYVLRQAGLHDECGELTDEGKELLLSYLEQMPDIKKQMVDTANELIKKQE